MAMNNDIADELNAMGSSLADAHQKLPFSVPDGYFANFQDLISDKVIENGAVPLKPLPYQVSPAYFATLPSLVLQNAKKHEGTQTKRPKLIALNPLKSIKPAIAATLMTIVCIGSYLMFLAPQYRQQTLLTDIAPAAIDEYLMPLEPTNAITSNNELQQLRLNNNDIILYLNETGWD
jgi:hypothetical protein